MATPRNFSEVLGQTLGQTSQNIPEQFQEMLMQRNFLIKQKMSGEINDFNRSIKLKGFEDQTLRTKASLRNTESLIEDRNRLNTINAVLARQLQTDVDLGGGISPETTSLISDVSSAQASGKPTKLRNMFTSADAQLAVGSDIAKADIPFQADISRERAAFQKTLGSSGTRYNPISGEKEGIESFQYLGGLKPADTARFVDLRLNQIVDDFSQAGQDPTPEIRKFIQGIIDYYGEQYLPVGQRPAVDSAFTPGAGAPPVGRRTRTPTTGGRSGSQFSEAGDVGLDTQSEAFGRKHIKNWDKLPNLTAKQQALEHLRTLLGGN